MKTLILVFGAVLNAASALAHSSLVPHEHPHDASALPLPDALALVLAALVVGCGFAVLRKFRKE